MRKFIAIAAALLIGTLFVANYNKSDKYADPSPAPISSPAPSGYQTSSTATNPLIIGGNPFSPNPPTELPGWFTSMPAPNSPVQFPGQYPDQQLPVQQQPIQQQPVQTPEQQPAQKPVAPPSTPTGSTSSAQQILQLVNEARASAGLGALSMDDGLNRVAMAKAQDMYANNYFDHTSPTYGSPFDMMKSFGISFNTAGENIAKGQTSAQQVMNDWMNSPGHRANILNGSYTRIGIAEYNGEWVQEFVG